jgi:hypothetical protein
MSRILFVFLLLFTFVLQADNRLKKRVFILHSYSQEYSWTKSQNDSFVQTLQRLSPSALDISVEYLDTKRIKFTPEYETFFLNYLQKKYDGYEPDVIYVTDDNALNFFIHYRSQLFSTKPIFFSGINNLSLIHTLDPSKYTGVYEAKEIIPNIELIRQFSPQTRDIWIVGDASNTYRSIESDIRSHISNYPKYSFHFLSSNRIGDITAQLPKTPKTFVLLTTIGELSDANGRNLTLKESIQILKQKQNIILCSMEDAYVQEGVIGGFVTSGVNQGSSAANLVSHYLNGDALKHIPSLIKSPNVYMFDRKGLLESRLVLSEYIARHAVIFHEKRTFFERYQQTILSAVFILFVLFIVFLIVNFMIISQKNTQIKKIGLELEECSDELSNVKDKLAVLEHSDE